MHNYEALVNGHRPCPSCGGLDAEKQREMAGEIILECRNCGSGFAARIPSIDELNATYAKLYSHVGGYDGYRHQLSQIEHAIKTGTPLRIGWEHKRFFSLAPKQHGASLLDVGSGVGFFLTAASQRGWKVTGVELSREAVELGRTVRCFQVHIGGVELAPLEEDSFSAITAWEVIEHLPYPREFLAKAVVLLKSGGVIAGSVPNYGRAAYRHGSKLGVASVPPVHLNFWTPSSLLQFLSLSGFVDAQIYSPRLCLDLLRPAGAITPSRVLRFLKVACALDEATSLFFIARKP